LENSWFKEIQRIAQPDYIPTESDILRIQDRSADVREYTFTTHKLNIRVFDWGVHNHKLVGMFHPFDALTSLLLVVDLSSYDEDEHHLPSGDSLNSVTTALETFGAIVNNQRFMRSGVILFFNKVGRFKQKLATHPLCNYFPDFSGGNNFERATDYIISRFHQVNQARRRIYIHFTESADRSNISMMFAAINDTLIRNGPPTAKLPTLRDLAIRIRKQTPKSQADNMSTTAIWAPIGYGYNPSTSLWLKTSAGNDSAPGQLIYYQPSDFPVYSI
jgi:guanine nucleotide-binding protein G(i) subunit alpha